MKIYEPNHKTRKKYRYELSEEDINTKIFLAGPFLGTYNWRQEFIDKLEEAGLGKYVSIINPCPEKLKTEFEYLDYQTQFESEGFERSDIVIFYIPKADDENNPEYAKTTRFELGHYLNNKFLEDHKVFLYIDNSFKGKDYILNINNRLNVTAKVCDDMDDIVSLMKVYVHTPKIWFTSDTHFGQQRTLDLSKRPYNNIYQMDANIEGRINALVRPWDTLYHLGDFGDPDYEDECDIKCENIILIRGNYDTDVVVDELLNRGIIKTAYNNLLIKPEDSCPLFLTHKPTDPLTEEAKACNAFKLFGHIHALQKVKRCGLNVGIDAHNFYPIDLDTILFYKNAIENHYDEDVFCD